MSAEEAHRLSGLPSLLYEIEIPEYRNIYLIQPVQYPDRASFISGLNHILVLGAIVAICGAVLAAILVRPQDFVASGPPPT